MIVDQVVDDFLEHHGIKGMKWGVRSKTLTPQQRRARQSKNIHRIHMGVKMAATTLFIASILGGSSHRGNRPVSYLTESVETVAKVKKSSKKISPNAREILRMQERQRNGAFHIKQMLKNMGETTL